MKIFPPKKRTCELLGAILKNSEISIYSSNSIFTFCFCEKFFLENFKKILLEKKRRKMLKNAQVCEKNQKYLL